MKLLVLAILVFISSSHAFAQPVLYPKGSSQWYASHRGASFGIKTAYRYCYKQKFHAKPKTHSIGCMRYTGHMFIVEKVNKHSIRYSDMNGIAGWGRVGKATIPMAQARLYLYVY